MKSIVVICALAGTTLHPCAADAKDLTYEDRVRAQEAIERVYYSHRSGPSIRFEAAVSRSVLEAKVNRYLGQSVALQVFWKTPITSDMLRNEMERQALETKMPDRLRELYVALGNDSVLIQECLVRPALVGRMVTRIFNFDPSIHRDAKQRADSLRLRLLGGEVDPYQDRVDRAVVDLIRMEPGQGAASEIQPEQTVRSVHQVSPAEFDAWHDRVSQSHGPIGPVEEEPSAFVIRVVLEEHPERIRLASFRVTKKKLEDWWTTVGPTFDVSSMPVVASTVPIPALGSSTSSSSIVLHGSVPQGGAPIPFATLAARFGHSAIWTGSEMIVWGGFPSGQGATGALYDPATDTWVATSTAGAPSPREYHTAVWTGTEMIVWGGQDQNGQQLVNSGGRYNPATDAWTSTTTMGAPQGRWFHSAFWTGRFMIVWGGGAARDLKNGGRYDPVKDKWLRIQTEGAPRGGGSVVWTGTEMIVWGGEHGRGHQTYLDTGARYDPNADTWVPTSTIGAPTPRSQHAAVWTGSEMIVWGGATDNQGTPGTGGRYDPASDTWTAATSEIGAPLSRTLPHAAWTGSEMIVWGGIPFLNTGGRYDPLSDTWASTSTVGAPAGKDGQTAIWCGTLFVVWGGDFTNLGGRYDPNTDSWTPTSTEVNF